MLLIYKLFIFKAFYLQRFLSTKLFTFKALASDNYFLTVTAET